jgi:hypothetical protein
LEYISPSSLKRVDFFLFHPTFCNHFFHDASDNQSLEAKKRKKPACHILSGKDQKHENIYKGDRQFVEFKKLFKISLWVI